MTMLTDDELTTLVVGRYANTGLDVPLAAVEQRGIRRRRNIRTFSAAAVAVIAVLIASATAFISEPPTRAPADTFAATCASGYADRIAARTDRAEVPVRLPAAIIDMRRGTAEFRLYATTGSDTVKRVVLDCNRTAAGQVTTSLTVATAVGVPALGDGTGVDYYRDFLPDGSGALVGTMVAGSQLTSVTTADGAPVPFASAHGFFVAWSSTGDLDNSVVAITTKDGDRITLNEPTNISGTFEAAQFNNACVRTLTSSSTGSPAFSGALSPALELSHGAEIVYVYVGNKIELCDFNTSATSHGFDLDSYSPRGFESEYGLEAFLGERSGIAVGRVPADATSVQISGDGATVDAQVSDGVFGAWLPTGLFTDPKATIIALSSTTRYTIVGAKMTTTSR